MATISTTARPAYVYDAGGDQWVPIAWTVLGSGAASAPALTFTGDSNTGLWSPGADTVAFSTGGVERLRIGSTGNVGIGTSSPSVAFHVSGQALVSANASGNAFEIRQTGSGNALVVEDSTNPDATPFVVTADGRVGVGTSSPAFIVDAVDATNATVAARGDATVQFVARRASTNAIPAALFFDKARGTIASPTVVSTGDVVGQLYFRGHDGTSFLSAASILAHVDGAPGLNDMPGALTFQTTADGAATPTERMRIDSSGNVGIGTSSPAARVDAASTGAAILYATRYSNNANQSPLFLRKSRGVNVGDNAAVQDGDGVGAIFFQGNDGSSFVTTAAIEANINGTFTAGSSTPSRLSFQTTPAGSTTLTERMRIDNAGLITGSGTSLGAWTAYTPTLGGTGWDIGNGTATGAYAQIGKMVIFRIQISFGSTSTFGASAAPTLTLPVTAISGSGIDTTGRNLGVSYRDASASKEYLGACTSTTTTITLRYLTTSGEKAFVTSTVPFTWDGTTADVIFVSGIYQAA